MVVTSATLDSALDQIGSTISIRVGSETIDPRGHGSLTWSETTGDGYVQVLTDTDTTVQAGLMNVGDAIGYFKQSTAIPDGSKIQVNHQGVWYEMIGDPNIPHISGNLLLKQITLRKHIE